MHHTGSSFLPYPYSNIQLYIAQLCGGHIWNIIGPMTLSLMSNSRGEWQSYHASVNIFLFGIEDLSTLPWVNIIKKRKPLVIKESQKKKDTEGSWPMSYWCDQNWLDSFQCERETLKGLIVGFLIPCIQFLYLILSYQGILGTSLFVRIGPGY